MIIVVDGTRQPYIDIENDVVKLDRVFYGHIANLAEIIVVQKEDHFIVVKDRYDIYKARRVFGRFTIEDFKQLVIQDSAERVKIERMGNET